MTSSLETGQSFLLTPPSEPFSSKLDKPVSEMEQKKKVQDKTENISNGRKNHRNFRTRFTDFVNFVPLAESMQFTMVY